MLVGHMPGRASGWISFFVIAESSELISCSMLEPISTESMIIEWGRAVIEHVLLLDLPEYGVRGNLFPGSPGSSSCV